MRLVLATRNDNKLRELGRVMIGVALEPLPEGVALPPEDGATDAANLAKLRANAPAGSRLRYVCVMAYAEPGGEERTFEGVCGGTLADEERGSGGFGYDPAFLPDDVADGRTMAELSDAEKDAISHRGRAARALLAWLEEGRPG